MSSFDRGGSTRAQKIKSEGGEEAYDFQETYDGLGEQLDEEDDAFNDETFGQIGDIGKDFNFGAMLGQGGAQVQPSQPQVKQNFSYAQAASNPIHDDEFMQDLWGTGNAPTKHTDTQVPQNPGENRILSLEEIEAQLTSIEGQNQFVNTQPQPHPFGMPGFSHQQMGGYMVPSGGFIPLPGQYGFSPGAVPGAGQIPPHLMMNTQGHFPQHQPIPPVEPNLQDQSTLQQPTQQIPSQMQPQIPAAMQVQQQQQIKHPDQLQSSGALQQPAEDQALASGTIDTSQNQQPAVKSPGGKGKPQKVNLSQFPVLGSKESPKQYVAAFEDHNQVSGGNFPLNRDRQSQRNFQLPHPDLTPEQEEKLNRRYEKVSRIMKYSGIMNPKDKDFVTRFQLSQIVTDDPYNEDFYAQVFKVIRPKTAATGMQPQEQQNNSIAQAYLDQSGHRLGGRYKRADVALQRMQQQVQKAVTVAKERPKLTQYAKEGALGKISFGSGKKPRQQIEILSKAAQREIERNGDKGDSEEKREDMSRSVKKYTRKDILRILEDIISNLMVVESESRESTVVENEKLWESLRVLDQPSTSGDDQAEVNPFIQCLDHNKALKVLPRLFRFLNRQQVLTIVTLVMSNLENLAVIKLGSYTTYNDQRLPEKVKHLVDTYSTTFSRVLMNAVQEFKFNEIIGLLVILIEHNNVSFVSTTKIGLTILTTLLSRAELIRGEGSMSATDLSEWSSCYDELFTSLESSIAAIFPPHDADDGSTGENYVWQFLATLSLGGKLSHQRIIVDEVRDQIFSAMNGAKAIDNSDLANLYKKQNILNNLNMYLVVMGLVADENEIKELQT